MEISKFFLEEINFWVFSVNLLRLTCLHVTFDLLWGLFRLVVRSDLSDRTSQTLWLNGSGRTRRRLTHRFGRAVRPQDVLQPPAELLHRVKGRRGGGVSIQTLGFQGRRRQQLGCFHWRLHPRSLKNRFYHLLPFSLFFKIFIVSFYIVFIFLLWSSLTISLLSYF